MSTRQLQIAAVFRSPRGLSIALPMLILTLNSISWAQSQEPTTRKTATKPVANQTTDSLAKLVDSLANKNSAPKLVGGAEAREPIFDKNYDWREQARIREALQVLVDHVEDAWPALVQHVADTQYSLTASMDHDGGNLSVGSVCSSIITANICMLYAGCLPRAAEDLRWSLRSPDILYGDDASIKSWCTSRKHKKLWELQIEVAEWVVKKIESCREEGLEERDRQKSINVLRKRIQKMQESKKAVVLKDIRDAWPCDVRYYNSEWAARIRNTQGSSKGVK